MAQGVKRLEQMRDNPKADWTIDDVRLVCRSVGVDLRDPTGGSHYKVVHASQRDILTVPAHRPIKSVYIKRLVKFIDAVKDSEQ
jgi:hypothetical protein